MNSSFLSLVLNNSKAPRFAASEYETYDQPKLGVFKKIVPVNMKIVGHVGIVLYLPNFHNTSIHGEVGTAHIHTGVINKKLRRATHTWTLHGKDKRTCKGGG